MNIDINNLPIYLDGSAGSIVRDAFTLSENLDILGGQGLHNRFIRVTDFLEILKAHGLQITTNEHPRPRTE